MAHNSSKGKEKPQKVYRVEAESSDGVVVTLGRYETKESAESDSRRIVEDAYYTNVNIIHTPPPEPEPEEGEAEAEATAKA